MKRPAIGTEVTVATAYRWGKGHVVGHLQLTTKRSDHGVFVVNVEEWHKGKPHNNVDLAEKILRVLGNSAKKKA
jgi:hypothetical protein